MDFGFGDALFSGCLRFSRSFDFFSSTGDGASSLALSIVSFINLQYRSIDLLASSLPGIGKFIPSGSEFVSNIAIIGIFNLILEEKKEVF